MRPRRAVVPRAPRRLVTSWAQAYRRYEETSARLARTGGAWAPDLVGVAFSSERTAAAWRQIVARRVLPGWAAVAVDVAACVFEERARHCDDLLPVPPAQRGGPS